MSILHLENIYGWSYHENQVLNNLSLILEFLGEI